MLQYEYDLTTCVRIYLCANTRWRH